MTIAIMQPYFLPYIGYWQLMAAVDQFVIYDNIQYTKKGWINRNRFLRNGEAVTFSLPLKKASDYLNIVERSLADDFAPRTLLNPFAEAYRKAPRFSEVFPVIESVVTAAPRNLFEYLKHSLVSVAKPLNIATPLVVSSTLAIDHGLRSEAKVIAICKALGADRYINSMGGQALYSRDTFAAEGIELAFMRTHVREYPQFGQPFVPALSVLDVMMFNSPDAIVRMLGDYELV